MESKNTPLQQKQQAKPEKTKFTFLDYVKLAYVTISFYSVMIFAEAPFWLLALIVVNFGIAAFVSNTIEWPVERDKDGKVIDHDKA